MTLAVLVLAWVLGGTLLALSLGRALWLLSDRRRVTEARRRYGLDGDS